MEASSDALNRQFDKLLVDMKPYVMSLSDRVDRQRCASWIKVLCQISANSGDFLSLGELKNRNTYAQQLFNMIRRGVLEGPFREDPPLHGVLERLTTQTNSLSLENYTKKYDFAENSATPAWVDTELNISSNSRLEKSPLSRTQSLRNPTRGGKPSSAIDTDWLGREFGGDRRRTVVNEDNKFVNSFQECRWYEEKLQLQQQNDTAVQNILARKNAELEALRRSSQSQIEQMQSQLRILESRFKTAVEELEDNRSSNTAKLQQIKALSQQNLEVAQQENSKRLQILQNRWESERAEIDRRHQSAMENIVSETERRLKEMEAEYSSQQNTTSQVTQDLENRVSILARETERLREENMELERLKMQAEYETQALNEGFIELRSRLEKFEVKYKSIIEENARDKREVLQKHSAALEEVNREKCDVVGGLKLKIDELEKSLADQRRLSTEKEFEHERRIKENECSWQSEKSMLEQRHHRQEQELQLERDLAERELRARAQRAEECLEQTTKEMSRLRELHRSELDQNQHTFEEFKSRVETSHQHVYDEMRMQVDNLKIQLNETNSANERQVRDFEQKMSRHKQQNDKVLAELRLKHEESKAQLIKEFAKERTQYAEEHERLSNQLKEKYKAKIKTLEDYHSDEVIRNKGMNEQLQRELQEAKLSLNNADARRRQQLTELGVIREKEKHDAVVERENALSQLRVNFENEKRQMLASHEKIVSMKVKEKQSEWEISKEELLAKIHEKANVIKDMDVELQQWREESLREATENEQRIAENEKKYQKKIECMRVEESRGREVILRDLTQRHEKQINDITLRHHSELKSMLPMSVRSEMESTIESLQKQVKCLQKTVNLLQGDDNLRNNSQRKTVELL